MPTPQADHEVAYELRKAFEEFVRLRKEMRKRGFTVSHPPIRDNLPPIASGFYHYDEDTLKVTKSTVVNY